MCTMHFAVICKYVSVLYLEHYKEKVQSRVKDGKSKISLKGRAYSLKQIENTLISITGIINLNWYLRN